MPKGHGMSDRLLRTRKILESVGQEHVLGFYENQDEVGKQNLLDQIASIDWSEAARLVETHVKHHVSFTLPETIEPAPWYPNVPTEDLKEQYQRARERGEELVGEGKVAVFTVAGGQGTRLGYNGPKGMFPATPITGTSLFACLAGYLRKVQEKFEAAVPWYIMTSPVNDADIRAFFEQNQYFELDPTMVIMFPQQMMPTFDATTAKVLLEAPGRLALSPNGHGGSLKALHTSGAIADMKRRGIEQISYTQVDNPLVHMIDPLFIGLHAIDGAQMSSKMLPKASPNEKVGVFCLLDGKVSVIEYSDLPNTLAEQRLENGQLRFRAGSIAIHLIHVDFVESLNSRRGHFALPFHRAEKIVPYVDFNSGKIVESKAPNAVKLEMFVFDALPLCATSIVYETARLDEFAPIKNACGADSPQTSRALQMERAARWLTTHGVRVPRDVEGKLNATIEIRPTTAICADDLRSVPLPVAIEPGGELLL